MAAKIGGESAKRNENRSYNRKLSLTNYRLSTIDFFNKIDDGVTDLFSLPVDAKEWKELAGKQDFNFILERKVYRRGA